MVKGKDNKARKALKRAAAKIGANEVDDDPTFAELAKSKNIKWLDNNTHIPEVRAVVETVMEELDGLRRHGREKFPDVEAFQVSWHDFTLQGALRLAGQLVKMIEIRERHPTVH